MNEDEAWERFTRVRDDQFKRSSALGTMDVMQAQLNELKANTEEIKQKIEEMAADNGGQPEAAPPQPPMGGAPDMSAMPGGEGQEGVDQTMDQTGAPGETGQDMMPPTQPQDEAPAGAGMPQMTDEDLDLLFGGGEQKNEEGTEESGEEVQDATLQALQDAISKATDPKVIADLAQMIVDYTGGGDSEGEKEEILPGVPDETPIEDVPKEEVEEIFKSESFEKAEGEQSFGDAPKQGVADTVKASNEQDKSTGGESAPVAGDSAQKGGFVATSEDGPTEEPGAVAESATCKSDSEDEGEDEKEDKEEDKKEESDDKKGEPEESESEDSDESDEEPEVTVTETVIEDEPEEAESDDVVAISDLLNMNFGDVIELVQGTTDAPQDDANVFINEQGKESVPFTNCSSIKRSVDDLIRERESTMVGIDGKKYQFTKSGKNARSIDMLNMDLHNYDKIAGMKAGEVLSAFKFMKSLGVKGVEEDNMDALDVIVRGLDSKIGGKNTNAFMKSAGMDLDAIYKSTEIKKSETAQGGKHIKTLAETGGMDIKKSADGTGDVPRAADAGKAYVTAQDMKAGLKSIDDLIAGRMKG